MAQPSRHRKGSAPRRGRVKSPHDLHISGQPGGVAAAFDKLARCYKKAGIPDRIKTSLYDAPHEFNGDMQQEAWAWLKRWV